MEKISIIKVEKLTKKYKKSQEYAVDSISFEVSTGDFFAFLGPNGAGKTTTVSILNTTLAKTSGYVNIAGFDIDKNPSQVRKNIGVIFQNPSLDENLTAEENIRLHSVLYGLYTYKPSFKLMPKSYQNKVIDLSKLLGIRKEIFSPIKTFSGGMKRKLEIIRSLTHHPKILFLDEPTSGLDPLSRKNLWNYLIDVKKKEKTTIFLTTHYLEEAEGADNIAIINKGKIVALGTPKEIKKDLVIGYIQAETNKKESLIKELISKNIKFTENGDFKIILNGKSPQKIIQSINTTLTRLDIHSPTLEEAYLNIIKE